MLPLCTKRRFGKLKTLAVLFLVTCIVYLLANIRLFAEYVFARGVTRSFSALINCITNVIPISFYEITAVLLVLGGIACIVAETAFLIKKEFSSALKLLYKILLVLLSVLISFGVLYAPLYKRQSLASSIGLEINQVTNTEVYTAAEYFIGKLNYCSEQVERDNDGNVLFPYSFNKISELINKGYDNLENNYFASYNVNPKRVVLSTAMSYLGITGIYFPFFAESNVNTNIPSYQIPVTMAHEIAHAKGVASESEANFAAYVVCICSDDIYLNYCGLMYAVANLVNNSGDYYSVLHSMIKDEIFTEYANASAHFAKYEGWIDDLSDFFNNLFLKANGVSGGTASYGDTTKSLVALYYSLT